MSAHGDTIGYVVVIYNQASHMPGLMYGADLFDSELEAVEVAQAERRDFRANGRGERVAVAKVVLRGEPE